jgi:hypothetical protein
MAKRRNCQTSFKHNTLLQNCDLGVFCQIQGTLTSFDAYAYKVHKISFGECGMISSFGKGKQGKI